MALVGLGLAWLLWAWLGVGWAWLGWVVLGLVWFGLVWFGLVSLGLAWLGMARLGFYISFSFSKRSMFPHFFSKIHYQLCAPTKLFSSPSTPKTWSRGDGSLG